MALLELAGVHIHYGGIEAVKGIDLKVEEGQIVTMIGANGAGKTTTLKTISGLKRPSAGAIAFRGRRIESKRPHQSRRTGLRCRSNGPDGLRWRAQRRTRLTTREPPRGPLDSSSDGQRLV